MSIDEYAQEKNRIYQWTANSLPNLQRETTEKVVECALID